MRHVHHEHRSLDVACRLGAADAGERADEWRRLREDAGQGVEAIPGGARLWLTPAALARTEDLVAREAVCCAFLDLDLVADHGVVRLDITSPSEEGATTIALLAGLGAAAEPARPPSGGTTYRPDD